jgi:hypothetical protein
MLKRYYLWWLLLSGVIGFAIGVGIKTAWEESKFIIGRETHGYSVSGQ